MRVPTPTLRPLLPKASTREPVACSGQWRAKDSLPRASFCCLETANPAGTQEPVETVHPDGLRRCAVLNKDQPELTPEAPHTPHQQLEHQQRITMSKQALGSKKNLHRDLV